MGRGLLLTSNLPQIQNLIKRDPIAYKEEFLQQWTHYNSIREIFKTNPDEQAQNFRELVTFIAQVATCYPNETKEFPTQISNLLLENYSTLSSDMRKTLVQNLVMLGNKDVITPIQCAIPSYHRAFFFDLRICRLKTILSDIRTANLRTKNHKLNKAVQAMLFGMVERGMKEAMWAIILTKELWKKNIWNDAKTVSIVSLGCLHPITKVQSASIHFFLSSDEEEESEKEEDDQEVDIQALHHRREINKKRRSNDKKLQKQLTTAKKKKHQRTQSSPNFPALQLLYDPQTFAEKLYDILNNYDKRFSLDHKVLLMQLLARVMGVHKLCILGFYTYIVKYLTYKQLRVPAILVALAQSVHDLTPPDALVPVIRKIAQEFVHPGVANEVIAAGLNSVREVCRRQPWAMEEDLLGDLVEYRKSRDKAVTAAARGLLRLYREVNPGMLKRRERGKEATMDMAGGAQPLPYGHTAEAAVDIEGLALLEDHLSKLREADETSLQDENDDAAWEGWEEDSSASSSESEGWIDVEDDDSSLIISESEDEGDATEKKKRQVEVDAGEVNRISQLATTKILTPADFALLNDLRIQAASKAAQAGSSQAKRKLAELESFKASKADNEDAFISENDILGPRKKAKADYAERMASVQKGREGREKFGSNKGKQKKETPSSSTNREKARNKPIMMILSSGAVRGKKKASLREKQQKLRAHIERGKKARR
ncbi:Protein sda1 [Leucoagaricus sp. SymC.cos]|nr:Protein sda1 [Leucoagaricus sp. SymC.cos]